MRWVFTLPFGIVLHSSAEQAKSLHAGGQKPRHENTALVKDATTPFRICFYKHTRTVINSHLFSYTAQFKNYWVIFDPQKHLFDSVAQREVRSKRLCILTVLAGRLKEQHLCCWTAGCWTRHLFVFLTEHHFYLGKKKKTDRKSDY